MPPGRLIGSARDGSSTRHAAMLIVLMQLPIADAQIIFLFFEPLATQFRLLEHIMLRVHHRMSATCSHLSVTGSE